jgi:CheY-like chemotaxis protein
MLLDFNMPGYNGVQVLQRLQHRLHPPRVVLWSSLPAQIDAPFALNLGADLVCAKPDSRVELVGIIQRLETDVFETEAPLTS